MSKLLKFGLKVSQVNVCCVRGFYCTALSFGKGAIRQRWDRNTDRCLQKAEKILSGDGHKNKYVNITSHHIEVTETDL